MKVIFFRMHKIGHFHQENAFANMVQCSCKTTSGTQCKRQASSDSKYCHQHQKCKKPISSKRKTSPPKVVPKPKVSPKLSTSDKCKDKICPTGKVCNPKTGRCIKPKASPKPKAVPKPKVSPKPKVAPKPKVSPAHSPTHGDVFIFARMLENAENRETVKNLCSMNKALREFCINNNEAALIFKERLRKETRGEYNFDNNTTIVDVRQMYPELNEAKNWLQVYLVLSRRAAYIETISAGDYYVAGVLSNGKISITIIDDVFAPQARFVPLKPQARFVPPKPQARFVPIPPRRRAPPEMKPPPGSKIVQVSAVADMLYGLTDDGKVMFGSSKDILYEGIVQISATENHLYALQNDGSIIKGNQAGGIINIITPPVGKEFVQIDANGHQCGALLNDGEIMVYNTAQTTVISSRSLYHPSGQRFIQVATGSMYTIGLLANGAVVVPPGFIKQVKRNMLPGDLRYLKETIGNNRYIQICATDDCFAGLLATGEVVCSYRHSSGIVADGWRKKYLLPPRGRRFVKITISSDCRVIGVLDNGSIGIALNTGRGGGNEHGKYVKGPPKGLKFV